MTSIRSQPSRSGMTSTRDKSCSSSGSLLKFSVKEIVSSSRVTHRMRYAAVSCSTSTGAWVSMSSEGKLLSMPVMGMYRFMMKLPDQMELPLLAVKQVGWQLYAGWQTEDQGARRTQRCPTHSRHIKERQAQKMPAVHIAAFACLDHIRSVKTGHWLCSDSKNLSHVKGAVQVDGSRYVL